MTIDLESWQAIGGAAGIVLVTAWSRYDSWRTKRAAQGGQEAAEKAAELSAPTGNGFARSVKDSLERIEAAQHRTEQKIDDHIAAHANAGLIEQSTHTRRILRDVNEL